MPAVFNNYVTLYLTGFSEPQLGVAGERMIPLLTETLLLWSRDLAAQKRA